VYSFSANFGKSMVCVTGVGFRRKVVGEMTGGSVVSVCTVSERPWVRATIFQMAPNVAASSLRYAFSYSVQ